MSTPLGDFGLCIVCQESIPAGEEGIHVGAEHSIPCCLKCWGSVPAGQRLAVAAKWREAPVISAALDVFRGLLDRAKSLDDGEDWLFKRN